MPPDTIPTGFPALDLALQTSGIPRGTLCELYGASGSGKTSLCQRIVAQAQVQGEACAWIDADYSLDPAYARRCGVDPDLLYVCEPANAEEALENAARLLRSGGLAVLVIDPINALATQAELDTPLGMPYTDSSSRLFSQALPGLVSAARQAGTALLFTRQTMSGEGPVYHQLAEHPDHLALMLHASIRLSLRAEGRFLEKDRPRNLQIQVQVVKNSFAPCFQIINLDIIDAGIGKFGEIPEIT